MNIEDLISQYIDGDLPSDAEAEMHHRLAVSPEARKLFRAQIALRGIARNPKVLHAPAPELRARLFDRLEREEGMKPQAPLSSSPLAHAAEMARPVPSPTASGDTRRRRRAIAWLLPTVMASIITVAIIWKPGGPLVRPDNPALADGSTGSVPAAPEAGTGQAPVELPATGAADAVAAPPAQKAPEKAATKDLAAPPSVAASPSRSVATMRTRSESPRRELAMGRTAFAPKVVSVDSTVGYDMKEGIGESARGDSRTLAAADIDGARKRSEPPSTPIARAPVIANASKPMKTSATEFGKKFDAPDIHTMEGGTHSKPERRDDGGNGGGPVADRVDGADKQPRLMAAPPPSGLASESLMSDANASTIQADTVAARPDKQMQTTPQAFSSSSQAEELADGVARSAPRFVIAVHQGSFVNTAAGTVDLDMGLRGGVQFDRGRQLVFAVIGISGYRSSISDSVTRLVANGVVSNPAASPQMLRERSYEVAGGLGYRYTVRLSKSWGVGAGAWSTVGAHYVRAGLEAPVTYTPARWLRVEIIPSMRYSGVHGGSATTGESRVLPSGDEETIQRITTPDGDGAIDIGIGFGASVMW